MFIKILIAAVIIILIAIIIVKWLPLKLRWLVSILLLGLSGYFSYLIFGSIMKPIKFNEIKKIRYAKVINKLILIRDAEEAHKKVTGHYEKDHQALIRFIDTAKFAITNSRNEVVKVNKGTRWQPIMVEIEKRIIDTTGYENVKDVLFKGRDYQNMFHLENSYITFEIKVDKIQKLTGVFVPVFEVKIDKANILKGLDKDLVRQEKEAIGGDEIKGAYISLGSLEEVNSTGNWPPFYERKKTRNN